MVETADGVMFIHVLFAFCMFGGSFAATVIRIIVMYQKSSRNVALLLGVVRPVVPIVLLCMFGAIGFGFWTAQEEGESLSERWLAVSYALVGYILVVGALAGRQDRKTRELAEKLATTEDPRGDGINQELKERLEDPVNWFLNLSMIGSMVVIIALMVMKPE